MTKWQESIAVVTMAGMIFFLGVTFGQKTAEMMAQRIEMRNGFMNISRAQNELVKRVGVLELLREPWPVRAADRDTLNKRKEAESLLEKK